MADDAYRKALREAAQDGSHLKSSAQDSGVIHHRKELLKADRMAQRFGRMRTMVNKWDGHVFYESSFNPDTGTLVRVTEEGTPKKWFKEWYGNDWQKIRSQEEAWKKHHGPGWACHDRAYSPVPETIDVAINNWCNHGCEYCYTDATVNGEHAPVDLVRRIIGGLDQPPYQIAYGGGSPTQHPEFIKILEVTKEMGVVPNYTTEGVNLTEKILAASSELCGGVAITFHAFRGKDVFAQRYERLRKGFRGQINVHLIADKDVATNLDALISLNAKQGRFNIVLLAYYPEVGRSDLGNLMPKPVYMVEFPAAIQRAMEAGNRIAFSEGLIPYFLSRPEIGVDTTMAIPTEGHFSCFIDMKGRMSTTSFNPPSDDHHTVWNAETQQHVPKPTVFNGRTQDMWRSLDVRGNSPDYAACGTCAKIYSCSIPNEHHHFICKYATHNEPESQPTRNRGMFSSEYDDWGFF